MSLAQHLLTPQELRVRYPLRQQDQGFISLCRQNVQSIVKGESDKKLLILGPCSVHSSEELLRYAEKFKALQSQVEDRFFCVLRVYIEKPRSCLGWKGLLYDPDLDSSYNLEKGLKVCRQLLVDLTAMEIPIAIEFLEPLVVSYFEDLISWGSIGARTSSSQIHRQMASALDCPVGFKNATDGNIDVACAGILSSSHSHSFFGVDTSGVLSHISSKGNPYAHLVLRGSCEQSNYSQNSVSHALRTLAAFGLSQRMIIDCAHGNSGKTVQGQLRAFQQVLQQWLEGADYVMGTMFESYLESGKQEWNEDASFKEGLSVTDPCLSYEQTESAILQAYDSLNSYSNSSVASCARA